MRIDNKMETPKVKCNDGTQEITPIDGDDAPKGQTVTPCEDTKPLHPTKGRAFDEYA
jgi:hypothetical protein